MKVVLDTNVLVSGTYWIGDSFRILELIDGGKLTLVLSNPIIQEYNRIISSNEIVEKIENKNLLVFKIVQSVIQKAKIVDPKERINFVKDDPDDNKILECAKAGKADFIVSQDKHLLKLQSFEGIRILKPSEFLGIKEKK
ncbi:MAG: putative toxin-antitoxin system toxin component, PIN family [Candidatus Woesearchaeota archaeon]